MSLLITIKLSLYIWPGTRKIPPGQFPPPVNSTRSNSPKPNSNPNPNPDPGENSPGGIDQGGILRTPSDLAHISVSRS